MRNPTPFSFAEITEDDIAWVCRVMGLADGAFDQARKDVLLSRQSLDVAACPGSGKTTLLVAKLAILARKWTDRGRGICVLSHTNAAREVIEERLGASAEGQALLNYPHYIGTIHGFLDRFLAIPYLRHKGWEVLVDDDLCNAKIESDVSYVADFGVGFKNAYRQLNHRHQKSFYKLKLLYLEGGIQVLPQCTEDHLNQFPNGTAIDEVHRFQKRLKALVSRSGIHAYDDMFVYGHRLLDVFPSAKQHITERFPLLYVDEAQDNSELQSNVLHRIFVDEDTGVICQRFGDANQAIYHGVNSQNNPTTWVFPAANLKRDIPDSHRFGQTIADFAAPLGVEPQALTGLGPDQKKVTADVDSQHAIFLFDEQARGHVLSTFADHIRASFNDDALARGSFVAIGAKHKEPENENNKPNSVCDYWEHYAPGQAKAEPRPQTFLGFVQVGRGRLEKDNGGNLNHIVEAIAAGILEAVRLAGGRTSSRQRKHRYIQEALADNPDTLDSYREFLRRFAVDGEVLMEQAWNSEWKDKISAVAQALFDGEEEYQCPQEFFVWPEDEGNGEDVRGAANIYQQEDLLPRIRLGSVHSVKGETHTGVLLLETFNRTYVMKAIKKWLLGNSGTEIQRNAQSTKLKVHYVAMTRPTHLLCLALPDKSFTAQEIQTLSGRGWRVAQIGADGVVAWICEQGEE